jgi:hypothetical protein
LRRNNDKRTGTGSLGRRVSRPAQIGGFLCRRRNSGAAMSQASIFAPMGTLALLTFSVLILIPILRFRAGALRQVTAEDFEFGESAAVPDRVSIPNRNYMNLLEIPMLFYVSSMMFFITGKVDTIVLTMAWIYVGLRSIHSLIHLTYNKVSHRLIPFAVSNVVLVAYWVLFFVR